VEKFLAAMLSMKWRERTVKRYRIMIFSSANGRRLVEVAFWMAPLTLPPFNHPTVDQIWSSNQ
jgi:hypothetical protein